MFFDGIIEEILKLGLIVAGLYLLFSFVVLMIYMAVQLDSGVHLKDRPRWQRLVFYQAFPVWLIFLGIYVVGDKIVQEGKRFRASNCTLAA